MSLCYLNVGDLIEVIFLKNCIFYLSESQRFELPETITTSVVLLNKEGIPNKFYYFNPSRYVTILFDGFVCSIGDTVLQDAYIAAQLRKRLNQK